MQAITLTLPNEKPVNWQHFYVGRHWSVRSRLKDAVRLTVRAAMPRCVLDAGPYNVPVEITVTAYMAGRRIDVDNLCTKVYVDALKGFVIEDDGPDYVTGVTPRVVSDKANPRIEITVTPTGDKETAGECKKMTSTP